MDIKQQGSNFLSGAFACRRTVCLCFWLIIVSGYSWAAEENYLVVGETGIQENKAVFATVESLKVVPARVRISGTIAEVLVTEGDRVESGQPIASVGDDKLALEVLALDSRIGGLRAQYNQARTDLDRMEQLYGAGTISQAAYDSAKTAFEVADKNLAAVQRERDVVLRQLDEGSVLAPVSGRVLEIPVTVGTVVMPGEHIATLAEENYVLRLEIPERHAAMMKLGDPVRIDDSEIGTGVAAEGFITRIYPRIENGRVYADARVEGLGNYFVGQRVRVWIPAGTRRGIIIPSEYVVNRSGIDWVRLAREEDSELEIPVRVGRSGPWGVEILSGVKSGDRLKAFAP